MCGAIWWSWIGRRRFSESSCFFLGSRREGGALRRRGDADELSLRGRHEQRVLFGNEDPEEVWGKEVTQLVEKRVKEEKRIRSYRV